MTPLLRSVDGRDGAALTVAHARGDEAPHLLDPDPRVARPSSSRHQSSGITVPTRDFR